jgi:hypothetical protein
MTAGRTTAGLVSVSAAALAEGVLWAMTIHQWKAAAISLGLLVTVAVGAGAFARQSQEPGNGPRSSAAAGGSSTQVRGGGDSTPSQERGEARKSQIPIGEPSSPARETGDGASTAVEPAPPENASLRVAREGFAMAMESFLAGRLDADKLHAWSIRIQELEFEDADQAHQRQALSAHTRRMEQLEAVAKSRQSAGEGSNLEILNARFYRQEAERMLSRFENRTVARPSRTPVDSPAPRSTDSTLGDQGEVGWTKLDHRTGGRSSPKAASSNAKPTPDEPGQDPRSQAIRKKLDASIAMNFAQETPLEEMLKHIKTSTVSPDFPNGIAIYVDPIGLQEAEKTLTSPIQLDLEGVPLRRTLYLMLKQLNLCYWIQDGMIVISSDSEDKGPLPSPIHEPSTRQRLENKLERGELSAEERKEYLEILQEASEIEKLKAEIAKHRGNREARAAGSGGGLQ